MRVLRWLVAAVVACGVFVVLVLWMAGVLTGGKIGPGRAAPGPAEPPPAGVSPAERTTVPVWYEAVGSFQSRTRVTIAAQITGRVVSVTVNEGDPIEANRVEPLIHLDDREFQARLNQARQGYEAAQAGEQRAAAARMAADARDSETAKNFERVKNLYATGAATASERDQAESEYLQAQAGVAQAVQGVLAAKAQVERAMEVVKEAAVALGYTKIHAHEGVAGVVAKRSADPGDLAWPGKALLVIHDPNQLRLEAFVREGLIARVRRGQTVPVVATALARELTGTVDEIVPAVDPASRSLLVKVAVPRTEGLFPGMFGKLRLRLDERETVVVPASAVVRVGQLEIVRVRRGEAWERRFVTTGERLGERIEVLSGLSGGETVGTAAAEDGR